MAEEIKNEDELEDMDDEDASLSDDVLGEVAGEEEEDADEDEPEGFGHIDDKEVKEVSENEEDDEEEEDDAALEDDAEDVDYDSFDDVDEL
jgi:hypothetical protein